MAAVKIVPRRDAKLYLSLIRERVLNFPIPSTLCCYKLRLGALGFRYNETLRERRGTVEGRDTQRMLQTDAKLGGGSKTGELWKFCAEV